MEKYTKKLNQMSKEKIEVREYLTDGDDAKLAFRKMMEENQKAGKHCDGLVISGHHTGAFAGKRSNATLSIKFLENLSCDPNYSSFFANVKALWLQGCRTLGVGKIETTDLADYHTVRVGQDIEVDRLPQDYSQLNFEFSDILDQDNPLSSRYLRIFPMATTFGWTKTSPGENSHSQYSIPLHIANIAKINAGIVADPIKINNLSVQAAGAQMVALLNLLNKRGNKCEANAVDAWLAHGDPKQSKLSLNNPDLSAYPSLNSQNDPILKRANELDCLLNGDCSTSEQQHKILEALDEILTSDQNIAYTLNALFQFTKSLKQRPELADFYKKIKEKLSASTNLRNFLFFKTQSETAILRKIDLFGFAKEFFDLSANERATIQNQLRSGFSKFASMPIKSEDFRGRDFTVTLFESLAKHQVLTGKDFVDLIQLPNIDPEILDRIPAKVTELQISDTEKTKVFQEILDSPKADGRTLHRVATALFRFKTPLPNTESLLEQILNSDKVDFSALDEVAYGLGNWTNPQINGERLLEKILNSNKSDESVLGTIARAIGKSKSPLVNGEKMLEQIMNSKKATAYTLGSVASAIGDSQHPLANGEKLLQEILNSSKASAPTLERVVDAIENSKTPLVNGEKMLQQIISSGKADGSILGRAGQVILRSKTPFVNGEKMFDQILNSNRAESNTFVLIGAAVFNSKLDLESSQKMLTRIFEAPKFASDSTFSLALTLGSSDLPDSTVKPLFRQILNSSTTNAATLKDVADRIQYTGDAIPKQRALELLDMISKSPSADASVQKSVGNAKSKLKSE